MTREPSYPHPGPIVRERTSRRKLLLHLVLFVMTFCTATVAGSLYPFGVNNRFPDIGADPQTLVELGRLILLMPMLYAAFIAAAVRDLAANPEYLTYGLSFSLSLLFILVSHEMGHYVACRLYRVEATLPFFIPTPPLIGPAGTFGAFIRIKSPLPSRKAVFDIGVAGPIAGFVALLPVAVVGVLMMQPIPPEQMPAAGSGGLVFSDPLLLRAIGAAAGIDVRFAMGNPFYFAAWLGLLVTALNLIPAGQLDGGHAVYAVLGEKAHYFTGRIAFVVMALFSVAGMYFYGSPSGFLFVVILALMLKIGHPRPWDESPLDAKRKLVALLTLLIFILSFTPFPIQIL
ncbi:MAG: site-2 protease family protein [Pyrinomonadaceae bacterium]